MDSHGFLPHSGVQVSKRSKLESRMNRHVLQLMGVLFAMCLVVAVGSGWWTAVNETYYLQSIPPPTLNHCCHAVTGMGEPW